MCTYKWEQSVRSEAQYYHSIVPNGDGDAQTEYNMSTCSLRTKMLYFDLALLLILKLNLTDLLCFHNCAQQNILKINSHTSYNAFHIIVYRFNT